MSKVQLITQTAYAKHRGVSEAAVSKAVKEQRIMLIEGKIDPAVADVQWAANSRARAPASGKAAQSSGPPGSSAPPRPTDGNAIADQDVDGDGYWNSRSRREAAEASIAEHKQAELQGQLIRVEAVEAVWSSALASVREHLLQVRARVAPLLAVESDPFKIEQLLDQEHNQALQLMAGAELGGSKV